MLPASVCAFCGRRLPVELSQRAASFPFCSSRCRNLDLGRWLNGEYAIARADDADAVDAVDAGDGSGGAGVALGRERTVHPLDPHRS